MRLLLMRLGVVEEVMRWLSMHHRLQKLPITCVDLATAFIAIEVHYIVVLVCIPTLVLCLKRKVTATGT